MMKSKEKKNKTKDDFEDFLVNSGFFYKYKDNPEEETVDAGNNLDDTNNSLGNNLGNNPGNNSDKNIAEEVKKILMAITAYFNQDLQNYYFVKFH